MSNRTISARSEGLYKEKGSKFLAFAVPVSGEEDVKRELTRLKKLYHDARHHCYAFVYGMETEHFRANDDGEPNHSAGDPILGQIRSANLTNVLVVVVRYFGGTKLGVGGLVNAYKTAASDAISAARIVEIYPEQTLTFTYSYEQTNLVNRLLDRFGAQIMEQSFTEFCVITIRVRKTDWPKLKNELIDAEIRVTVQDTRS